MKRRNLCVSAFNRSSVEAAQISRRVQNYYIFINSWKFCVIIDLKYSLFMVTSSKVKNKYMIMMRNLSLCCASGASGGIATEQGNISADVRRESHMQMNPM